MSTILSARRIFWSPVGGGQGWWAAAESSISFQPTEHVKDNAVCQKETPVLKYIGVAGKSLA
jgi:hypothetical protein